MIRPKQVFLAVEPVDMRWGMERLSCHVQHHLAQPPSEGRAWGFTNRPQPASQVVSGYVGYRLTAGVRVSWPGDSWSTKADHHQRVAKWLLRCDKPTLKKSCNLKRCQSTRKQLVIISAF